jgi:hypothetical protein
MSTAPDVGPIVVHDEKHDVSPPLRDIRPAPPQPKVERDTLRHLPKSPGKQDVDTVVQKAFGPFVMPTPILTFAGVNSAASMCACYPPDTNGDVGPNHYVQTVNTSFAIWDKNGIAVQAPRSINTLWSGFGGSCQTRNDGDPIVKYDQLADRWVISQFTSAAPYYECIAVSTTGDPTGSYARYAFLESNTVLGDYPKMGVWPDAYYMSTNEFNASGTTYLGAGNYAFDRTRMLQGLSATALYFHLPPSDWGGHQPSDLDGSILPPAGAPNLFVEIDDSAWDPPNIPTDQMQMWRFHADFAVPGNSTFTALPAIIPPALAPFDGILCSFNPCVPQPGTAQTLDTLADRVMYRVAYRHFPDNHEAIVFNHTVDAGTNKAAVRWYEVRGINGTPSIYQQGTFDPNTDHHWMGSFAMDSQGNAALGYSVSSSVTFPSVRYSGRLATDPLGQLPQGEAAIVNGTGSQTGTAGRWGDYSSMVVDPADDCTFWYTNEYYITTTAVNWQTMIGKFKFPSCVAPVGGTPSPTVPPSATSTVGTPQPTATPCTLSFSDVHSTDFFYTPVLYLACHGVVSGYADGTFRPYNNTTRSQMVKIVVLGFNIPISTPTPSGAHTFADVTADNTFFSFVETAASQNIASGYTCGGPGEPCDSENRPYFRPFANVTRGQLSKIDVVAAGWSLGTPPPPGTFEDVPPTNVFYTYIETAYCHGVISGYNCGGPGEPCDPSNRPYFRWFNDATRGQIAKIVYLSITGSTPCIAR